MKITLAGIWGVAWSLWHLAWLGGLWWGATLLGGDLDALRLYFQILYTIFLPMELLGWRDLLDDPPGREHVKTLSQFRQIPAVVLAKQGSPWYLGWKALAALTGCVDGWIVGWMVWQVSPPLGVGVGIVVAFWLAPHFAVRDRVG